VVGIAPTDSAPTVELPRVSTVGFGQQEKLIPYRVKLYFGRTGLRSVTMLLLTAVACQTSDSPSSPFEVKTAISPGCSAVSQTLEGSWQLALENAKLAYDIHRSSIKNTQSVAVINYVTTNDSNDRLRLYIPSEDWALSGSYWVAHAAKSDASYSDSGEILDGASCATTFSNVPQSNFSSKGPFITAKKKAPSKFGRENLRLHGLDPELNGNAYKRDIVFHQALQNGTSIDYSLGCPMLRPADLDPVLNAIVGGAFVYVHQQ